MVEKLPALVLTALIVFLGLQPNWLMRWTEPTPVSIVASNYETSSNQPSIKSVANMFRLQKEEVPLAANHLQETS